MDIRPVLYIIGILLCILAGSMSIPLLGDLAAGHHDWIVFFFCMLVTAFFGGLLVLTNSGRHEKISLRQGFLMVSLTWVTLCLFAALPFWFSDMGLDFTNALFEATSGLTTTGATIIDALDTAPPGILLWRAVLQWLGGIGIIIMAMSLLPFLRIGGMQIFQTESPDNEKALPRAKRLAHSIGLIYVFLTFLCILAYCFTGLSIFESFTHGLSTISTGGFSIYDTSFGAFTRTGPLLVGIVFMIVGGLPFVLYLKASKGHLAPLWQDTQVRCFLSIVLLAVMAVSYTLHQTGNFTPADALLHAGFNVVAVITGSGFTSMDYNIWPPFTVTLLFCLMAMGACAGSTTCGIKIFRFQILYAVIDTQIRKMIHPNGTFVPHYNGKPVNETIPLAVMGFVFLYALSFALLALALTLTGLDSITALSGALSAISNVGPGIGNLIGPAGTYAALNEPAKWVLCLGMLLGRLEIFPLLILFSPHFWRP